MFLCCTKVNTNFNSERKHSADFSCVRGLHFFNIQNQLLSYFQCIDTIRIMSTAQLIFFIYAVIYTGVPKMYTHNKRCYLFVCITFRS
jgi:hypothetical protein